MASFPPSIRPISVLVAFALLLPLFSIGAMAAAMPDAPTDLKAVGGNAKVTLTWTAPGYDGGASIVGYLLYKGETLESMQYFKTLPATPLLYLDTDVINGRTYHYNITAHNSQVEGAHSTTVSATPQNPPSAPTAAKAIPGIGQMTLDWNPPYNDGGLPVTMYKIYRGTSASLLLYLKDTTTTDAIDLGLSNGQTYYYQISAVNALGEGDRCAVFSGTLASAPGPLLDILAVAGDSKVTLTWTAPTNTGGSPITGFLVYRSTISGSWTVLSPSTTPSYQDLNLVNGQTYIYKVSAVNAVGEGELSGEVAVTPAAVLGPPTAIIATPADSTIQLNWSAPYNSGGYAATSFKIFRGTSATTLLYLRTVTQNSSLDIGLTNGLTYYYKLSTVNSVGEGPQSAAVSATPFTVPAVPQTVNVVAGNSGVSLSWTAPASNGGSSILRYHINWSTSATGPWNTIDTLGPGLVYPQTGLTNGQQYFYKVAAVNAAGEGPFSSILSATPRTVPVAPAISSAVGGIGNVTILVTAPAENGGSPITKYYLYRGTSSGSESFLVDLSLSTGHVDSAVTPGTTYYYKVTAWNAQGESLRSGAISATTFGAPAAPRSLVATVGDGVLSMRWAAPSSDGGSPVTFYKVYYGTSSGTYTGNQVISSTSFVQTSLTNGVRYFYAVSAMNAVGEGPISTETSAVPLSNPTAPQNVQATGGVRQITISWQPPAVDGGSGVTGYRVYRGGSAESQIELATVGTELVFVDSGLPDGTTYHYTVTAINSLGEGSRSSDALATTNSVPSVPTSFIVSVGNAQAALAWNVPDNIGGTAITGYVIHRSVNGGTPSVLTTTSSLSYIDGGLENGQSYGYSVSALNAVGEGQACAQTVVSPATLPTAPQTPIATPGDGSIALSWFAPTSDGGSTIIGYRILRGTSPGSEIEVSTTDETTYLDDHLGLAETYYYEVVAYNAVGDGASSMEVHATTFTIPGAPQFLHATASDGVVQLVWTAPSNNGGAAISSYTILRGTSIDTLTPLTSLSSTSYTDTGLSNGQVYHYAVIASNIVGDGPESDPASATPSRTPSAPLSPAAVAGIRQISISWAAPLENGGSPVTSYRLYRSATSNGTLDLLVSLSSRSYTDTILDNGKQYFYRIVAVNSAGEGAQASVNATTYALPPTPVLAASSTGQDVQLTWTVPSSTATSYRIYRGTSSGGETYLRSVLTNGYVDGPLMSATTYFYVVTAVDPIGEGAFSNEVSATLAVPPSEPTGLAATATGSQIELNWTEPLLNGGGAITGYHVLRGTTSGSEAFLANCDNIRYNDTTAVVGQQYYYTVRAVNGAGDGPGSNEANATISDSFTAPRSLKAIAGVDKVVLSWLPPASTNGDTLVGYNVYRGTSSGGETLLITASVTEFTDTGVEVGRTYYYQVSGHTSTREGPRTDEVQARPFALPGAPTDLKAVGGDGKITLNWTAPANDGGSAIAGYNIYSGSASGQEAFLTSTDDIGHVDTGLASGTTWYYVVKAYNAGGEGNASNEAMAKTSTAVDPPLGLTAVASDGRVSLTWNAPIGVQIFTYSIFRGNDSGGGELITNDPNTKWVDRNVTNGKTYYYRVLAVTNQGESDPSNQVSATPSGNADPVPGGLLDQLWFRIVVIMTIMAGGFFAFVWFVRKGAVEVKRGR